MIKEIKHSGLETVSIFTLDKPQPVKNTFYMLFPVKGTLEITGPDGAIRDMRRITIKDHADLIRVIYRSAS